MKIFRNILTCLLIVTGLTARAQQDDVPHIVQGPIDWNEVQTTPFKFNQKDLVMLIVRTEGLTNMFAEEMDLHWVDDFHFLDMNNDRLVDVVYSGETKFNKGFYTMVFIGDSARSYPKKFGGYGYLNELKFDSKGIDLTLRQEAYGANYLVSVHKYRYDYLPDSVTKKWEVQYVSTTEVPQTGEIKGGTLPNDVVLRTSPAILNEPPVDYDQDGKFDSAGNAVGKFKEGTPLLKLAYLEKKDMDWAFVILLEPPVEQHVFRLNQDIYTGYCGWIPVKK